MSSSQALAALLICIILGMTGQGIRALLGLKSAATLQPGGPTQQSQFDAAYFNITLLVGGLAGAASGILLGLGNFNPFPVGDTKLVLSVIAAGYAGTDFIENALGKLLPGLNAPPVAAEAPPQPAVAAFVQPQAATPPNPAPALTRSLNIVAPAVNTGKWTPALLAAFNKFDLNNNRRIAAAIGQFLVEAGASFQYVEENLNYSAQGLMDNFGPEFPNLASTAGYVGNPVKIANRAYADKNGNGNEASGDGYTFRGRGLIQVTGRRNYTLLANALGKTLDDTLAYCETAEGAAMSGCWYLASNGCLQLADSWSIDTITERVNGPAMRGQTTRLEDSNAMLKALGG